MYDAIILSKAGIDALNLNNHIAQEFSVKEVIPSVGQGVIAIQCRENDYDMIEFLKKINHKETSICVFSEREMLKILEGDCAKAIGAFESIVNEKIKLVAELFSIDGKKRYFLESSKELNLAKELGAEIGIILKNKSEGNYKR